MGSRHQLEVEREIELPGGMWLMVPPRPREAVVEAGTSRAASLSSLERALFPPFIHRGDRRQPPLAQSG